MLCSLARLDGYRSALERAGVAFDPALVRYGDFEHEGGFIRAVELLAQHLGSAAAQMLGELIEGLPLRSNRMELSTELIVRESTSAPKTTAPTSRPSREVIHLVPQASAATAAETDLEADPSPEAEIWRDPERPVAKRVANLLAAMTLEEKLAQLGSVRQGASGDGDGVAPMQDQFSDELAPLDELIKNGMGQLARVFGTRPVTPAAGMRALGALQARIVAASRFGIPAVAHEECLTGFAAWTATIYPTPLAWGASFDPDLVREMALAFGTTMRAVGIHQGLAPVLDVTRDPRWGRTEETIGGDPYLVATVGTGYVQGLQSAGVQATLKHFAGYSASHAARNMAPVSMGPREFADVILPPFEMAISLGGARSVMPSYTDIDGAPASADPLLLRTLLRDTLAFDGLVVSDYYAISFIELQHAITASPAGAAVLALTAGVDVELPSVRCYGEPLRTAAIAGDIPAAAIDRAAARVLRQKFELGLLDPGWTVILGEVIGASEVMGASEVIGGGEAEADMDPPAQRAIARRLAEESIVLLAPGCR